VLDRDGRRVRVLSDDEGEEVKSGEAFGWVLTGLINDHIVIWGDYENPADDKVDFHPDRCGLCGALRDYFLTPRGRDEMDVFVRQVPKSGQGEDWRNDDGTVNWIEIDRRLALPRRRDDE
jgi:hypothetical protein